MKMLIQPKSITFLILTLLCITSYLCAECSGQSPRILWQREYGCSDGLSCSIGTATFSKTEDKLLIMGTSFRPKTYTDGKICLWEFEQNGDRVKSVVLKEVSDDHRSPITLACAMIKDMAISKYGEILSVGKWNNGSESFNKTSRIGQEVFTMPVHKNGDKKEDVQILKMINLIDNSVLLICSIQPGNGLVIKVDPNGDKLWERTYDLGDRGVIFTDAALLEEDGDFVLLGFTGNVEEISGVLLFDLVLFRCDTQGKVLTQELFPGGISRMSEPQICRLDSGSLVVTYDKNVELKVMDQRIRAFSPDLKLFWEKQVIQKETRRPIGFKIGSVGGGSFVVAYDVLGDLFLYHYDKDGNRVSHTCLDKFVFAGKFDLVTTEDKAFVISQTRPDKEIGVSKVKVAAIEFAP